MVKTNIPTTTNTSNDFPLEFPISFRDTEDIGVKSIKIIKVSGKRVVFNV